MRNRNFKYPVFLTVLIIGLISLFMVNRQDKSCMQFSVSPFFGNKMVLQRGMEIPVWGTATPKENISVQLNDKKIKVITGTDGKWIAYIPKFKAGGPYDLIISAKDSTIHYSDVLIGEVWLASGQSNMHLPVIKTENGDSLARLANNKQIRLFNMRTIYPTGENGTYTIDELTAINENRLFKIEPWDYPSYEKVLYYSAAVWYFAEKLQKELGVPVGIIQNAVPGAPTESWISNKVLENDERYRKLVETPWYENDTNGCGKIMLDVAINQVAAVDLKTQKHPWMPGYNYENGIKPMLPFAIKGVIWYQGESNAGNYKMHEDLLKIMVKSWRKKWDEGDFPFIYAQLTGREGRDTWPVFRDSQRRLLDEIPNSGMAIISDVGDRNDTHARKKKEVGERLAIWALGSVYGKGVVPSGPLFKGFTKKDNNIIVSFNFAGECLSTSDGKELRGFEIAGEDKIFKPVKAVIDNKQVVIIPRERLMGEHFIRYAWKPFPDANLINSAGLPASTFSSEKYPGKVILKKINK